MSKNIETSEQDMNISYIMDGVMSYGNYLYDFENVDLDADDTFLIALDSPEAYKEALGKAHSISEEDLKKYEWHIIFKKPSYATPYFLMLSMTSDSFLTLSKQCELNESFHKWLDTYDLHEDHYSGSHWELEGLLNELCDARFNKN